MLRAEHLTFRIGQQTLIDDVSLTVESCSTLR